MKRTTHNKGIFICGTDTGVGKTLIGGAIARGLILNGIDCGVMKPIESGCRIRDNKLIPSDGSYLRAAARSAEPLETISPYRYRQPMAPYAIAIQEKGKILELKKIVRIYKRLQANHRFLIVEGLGGLMVPLTAELTVIDLIRHLELSVLLVARSGLGTINHTLLTIYHGEKRGISFLGVVLNRTSPRKEPSEETNLKILTEKTNLPVVGPFPYVGENGKRENQIKRSATRFDQNLPMKEMIYALIRQID